MFSRIRRRITYANVAMTLALVFAMTGGAYAAKKYLITSTKQIKPSVLAQLKGKAGPAGPASAPGTQGPQGAQGPAGKNGTNGTNGVNGKDGKEGPEGKEGSPWTTGGTLPSGKTETGTWGIASPPGSFFGGSSQEVVIPISFTIPLKEPLPATSVHVIATGASGAGGKTCPTTSNVEKPEAEPGNFCIFEREGFNVESIEIFSPGMAEPSELGRTGTLVKIQPATKGESIFVAGTWAVTAE
jgi:hypothetical protein